MQRSHKAQRRAPSAKKAVQPKARKMHTAARPQAKIQVKKVAQKKQLVRQQIQMPARTFATLNHSVENHKVAPVGAPSAPKATRNISDLGTLISGAKPGILERFDRRFLGSWLTARGLYIEDLYTDNELTHLAVNMLPADIRQDRHRRIIRALECDLKFVFINEELQQYDPFVSYGLDDQLRKIDVDVREAQAYI